MEQEDEAAIIQKAVETSIDRRGRRLFRIIVLAGLVAFVLGGGAVVATYLALTSTAKDGTLLAQQIQQECDKPGVTDPDLQQFCDSADKVVRSAPDQVKADTPVPGPAGPSGPAGPQGEKGDDGVDAPAPSADQVAQAVRSFCNDTGNCRGPAGRDGSNATAAQVAIAVSSYCDDQGQCRGPVGAAGKDGTDAAPVTQTQIIAAVETYCSTNDNCRGPAGQDGTNGTDGQNGSDSTVPGPVGVVNVVDDCGPAPDGQVIADVNPSYDADTKTIIIECTYKDDQQGILNP